MMAAQLEALHRQLQRPRYDPIEPVVHRFPARDCRKSVCTDTCCAFLDELSSTDVEFFLFLAMVYFSIGDEGRVS
jgi:hypothetical protein